MNEISNSNNFDPLKINEYMSLDRNEEIVKQTIVGSHGFEINKYTSHNVTIVEGRVGSGKTTYMQNYLSFDYSKKLLLASESDCEYEYLITPNIIKVGYYSDHYDSRFSNINVIDKLLNILNRELVNKYDVVIIDNIYLTSSDDVNRLFTLCLQYSHSKFFILNNHVKS